MLASLPYKSPPLLLFTLIAAALCALPGCDRDGDPRQIDDDQLRETTQAPTETDSDPTVDDDDPLVARGGPIELRLSDVATAVHRLRLMDPGVAEGQIPDQEPTWMQYPRAQIEMLNNLVQFSVARHAAAERNLSITEDQFLDFLIAHPTLQRYRSLFADPYLEGPEQPLVEDLQAELAAADLGLEDIRHLVEDMLYLKVLDDHLAQDFSDDQLWGVYQNAYDQAALVVASLRNTPTSAELDRAMRQYDREIRTHYRENRQRYRTALQLWATAMGPENPEAFEAADLEAQLELAAQRLADGDDPETIADEMGFDVNPRVYLHRRHYPNAQHAQVGDTGVSISPQLAVAWKVHDRQEAAPRPLDRPLRREIASTIIRQEEGITPANQARAQQALDLLAAADHGQALDPSQIDTLVQQLEAAGFDATSTDLFSLQMSGAIPTLGLAENLLEATRQADLDDPIIGPVLDRQSIHVARLVDRQHPDRQSFEDELDDFRPEFLARNKGRMVRQFIIDFREEQDIQIDRRPLVDSYGEISKKPGAPPQAMPQ